MTIEEQRFVDEREAMLPDVLDFVKSHKGEPLYQNDVVSALNQYPEKLVVSAIWRLLDMHRLDLNKRLAIVAAVGA